MAVYSAQPSLYLCRMILSAVILLLLHGPGLGPTLEALPPAVEAQPDDAHSDWQTEVAQESLAHAFATLTGVGIDEATEITSLAEQEASQYFIDPFRVLAFIVAESWGDPRARSRVGARGLMQIMPATGRGIAREREETWGGIKSLYDVETNITYGVWYYHHLLETFEGDEMAAIAAYNWGPEHIRWRMRKGRQLPKVYPGKVLRAQVKLEREFANEITTRYWRSFIKHNPDPRARRGLSRPRTGEQT